MMIFSLFILLCIALTSCATTLGFVSNFRFHKMAATPGGGEATSSASAARPLSIPGDCKIPRNQLYDM